jgi:hypothetical protein
MAIRLVTSFGYGTNAGVTIGAAGSRNVDLITGTPAGVVSTNPRHDVYALRINPTGVSQSWFWDSNTVGTGQTVGGVGVWIRFNTALPSATVQVFAIVWATDDAIIQYNQSTGKISCLWQNGTAVDGPTVSANTWYHVELIADCTTSSACLITWYVDGVQQTSPANRSGAQTISGVDLGNQFVAQTMDVNYSDLVIDTSTGSVNINGKATVRLLVVDPAGTVSITGTTANWNTFAGATPTLTAWNATTARNALDEVPVNTLASQDGVAQITASGTDCCNVPMTTYTLAAGETVLGVRALMVGWQAAATSGNIGLRIFNGTTEETLLAATAYTILGNNTANPGWICKMATLANFDAQAEIDAMVIRFGFSTDATPDMGAQAVYAEIAIKDAAPATNKVPAMITQLGGFY